MNGWNPIRPQLTSKNETDPVIFGGLGKVVIVIVLNSDFLSFLIVAMSTLYLTDGSRPDTFIFFRVEGIISSNISLFSRTFLIFSLYPVKWVVTSSQL